MKSKFIKQKFGKYFLKRESFEKRFFMTDMVVSILVATLFKESSISIMQIRYYFNKTNQIFGPHRQFKKNYLSPGASTILVVAFLK
jgi:hypothetical protein